METKKHRPDLRVEKAKMRQRPMLKELTDSNGKTTLQKTGAKQNYKKGYLMNGKLTKTKAWKELLEEELADGELIKIHKGLLKHKEWRARDAGLDKAYKVKHYYVNGVKVTSKWAGRSKEEIVEFIIGGID